MPALDQPGPQRGASLWDPSCSLPHESPKVPTGATQQGQAAWPSCLCSPLDVQVHSHPIGPAFWGSLRHAVAFPDWAEKAEGL